MAHQLAAPECEQVLSPKAWMCWADEDFIGRVSRVSRRAHALTTARRTIERCLGLYRRQWASVFDPVYKNGKGKQ